MAIKRFANTESTDDVPQPFADTESTDDVPKQQEAVPNKPNKAAGKKKSRKRRHPSYRNYIYKVLKKVHPALGMSQTAMKVMQSFMEDIFEKIANHASIFARSNKEATISTRAIQSAVRIVLINSGEFQKYANMAGEVALWKFSDSRRSQ